MKKKYYAKLDLIRLYFCAAVFLYHLHILKGGYLAVSSFFVLSGYLSVLSFERKKKISFRDYYLSRFVRICLPLLAVVFLTIALISLIPSISWIEMKRETTSVIFGYNNYWQLNASLDYFTRHISSPFMHLWYIAILLQYEILLPFFCLLLKKVSSKLMRPLICFVIALLSFVVFFVLTKKGHLMNAYYGTFARSFSLFFGMALGYIRSSGYSFTIRNRKTSSLIFLVCLALLGVLFLFCDASSSFFAWGMLGTSLITMRLIDYATLYGNRRDPLLQYLGSMSYMIYLVQYPIIYLLENSEAPVFLQVILSLVLTMIVSFLLNEAFSILKDRRRRIFRLILCLLIVTASLYGCWKYLSAKDHSKEMKELEEKLNENAKLIEEKNREHQNVSDQEEKAMQALIEGMDNKEEAVRKMLEEMPVLGVGDSILIDVADELYRVFPNGCFDGKVSRDLYHGNEILEELKEEGKLPNTIILCLSTNGDYIESCNERLMEIVEGRDVFWVDAVGPDDPEFNERFADFAKNYENLHIVEWEKVSEGHPEYFYYDNIHVMEEGVPALTQEIYDRIYQVYLDRYAQMYEEALANSAEKAKRRVACFGNDPLIASYSCLNEKGLTSFCYAAEDISYEEVSAKVKERIEAGELENRVVFLFDSQARMKEKDYASLVSLCQGHEVYVVNMTNKKLSLAATVIDVYEQLKENSDYLMADGIHLSETGTAFIADQIYQVISK